MLYSSPLRRSMATLDITWCVFSVTTSSRGVIADSLTRSLIPRLRKDILLDPKKANHKTPIIKEHFRESIGLHTCDERSKKSDIAAMYPAWAFEPTFTQNDQLVSNLVSWGPETRSAA